VPIDAQSYFNILFTIVKRQGTHGAESQWQIEDADICEQLDIFAQFSRGPALDKSTGVEELTNNCQSRGLAKQNVRRFLCRNPDEDGITHPISQCLHGF
jgi:hypothetical protein